MNLEIKHLAHYLPYGLRIESQKGNGDLDYKGLKKEMTLFNLHKVDGDKWKPLLRPIETLITPCFSNGIIPLVELIDKECGYIVLNNADMNFEVGQLEDCFFAKIENENNLDDEFWYFKDYPSFRLMLSHVALPQLQLFEKLFEWHFDVFGLIDQGLALPLI